MPPVAALYVDTARGPYQSIPGVDCWGIERDATQYAGPWPVVAHPPCGHWGRYFYRAHDDGHTGPIAVDQVRRWGGVLEHPRASRLWTHCGLPRPGDLPDEWGGWSAEIEQGDWGHRAQKPTWIYVVGAGSLPPMPPRRPPPVRTGRARGVLEVMSKAQRHLTPPAFAAWLVEIAARCQPPGQIRCR
jgi:hypothetical protein